MNLFTHMMVTIAPPAPTVLPDGIHGAVTGTHMKLYTGGKEEQNYVEPEPKPEAQLGN